jgi:hypothetical protein
MINGWVGSQAGVPLLGVGPGLPTRIELENGRSKLRRWDVRDDEPSFEFSRHFGLDRTGIIKSLIDGRSVPWSRHGDWDIASTGQLEAPVAKGVCHYLSATAVIELYGSCLDIHRLHMGGLEWALSSMYMLP